MSFLLPGAFWMSAHTAVSDASANSAGLTLEEIAALNEAYAPLGFAERIHRLYEDFDPDKVLVTSSFAATSAYFLHIISRLRPEQVISFVDTGFHFPETLGYRDHLIERFNLKVKDLRADPQQHEWSVKEKLYDSDPDFCCSINKVQPLEEVKKNYHVWVSSLMRWQSDHRADMEIFEERRGIIKFNPMIDVSKAERDEYIVEHSLPFHPMVACGYSSIGCTHCTVQGEGRSGRWAGKPKTECGLHY
jgi:phosphoadenosine phosphosulfate reductase